METKAVDNFNSGYNCAQAVLSVFCGDDGDRLLMAATSFGGGIAGTGHMCGCLSGALFAIGLLQGKTTINNPANRKENYAIARTLCERFKKEFGSTECRELTRTNLLDDSEYKKAVDSGLFKNRCALMVDVCVRLVREVTAVPGDH